MIFPNTNFIDGQTPVLSQWLNAVNTKCMQTVSVKDFGAVGDGTTDDTAAIQAAITQAEANGGAVYIPAGAYLTSSPLIISNPLTLIGDGFGYSFTANPSNEGSTILGSHLYGPIIRVKSSNVTLQNFCVSSTSARKAAAYVVGTTYAGLGLTRDDQNFGIWVEADDTSGAANDTIFIENVWAYKQPAAGIVLIGATYGSRISHCGVNNNYTNGHGFVVDNGDFTGRTNKVIAGVLSIDDCQSYKMGGNALVVGTPYIVSGAPTIRVLVHNMDCYNAGTTASTRLVPYSVFFYSDNSVIQYSAFGGANGVVGGLYIGGRNLQVLNNRYLDTTQPIKIASPIGAGTRATSAVDIHDMLITKASGVHPYAIDVDATATGVNAYLGTTDGKFTDLTNNPILENQVISNRFWEGQLVVGKTVADDNTKGARIYSDTTGGILSATRTSNVAGIFNRTTTEGDLVVFRYAGIEVGGIGVTANTTKFYTLNSATGPFFTSGSNSPEGVVTAPVGSLYTRTNGGAGTTLYVKESGTGNTGWVAK